VVTGKGNAEALFSSPHGAGRRFSRGEAKRTFTTDELEHAMEGIEYNREHAREFLDEIPAAYKPIGQIMRDSEDLVEIRHTLHQVVNVKGD
jgi:tRNA-splicing ligase RtcB